MSKAVALTRHAVQQGAHYARMAIVLACGASLVLAGRFLPF